MGIVRTGWGLAAAAGLALASCAPAPQPKTVSLRLSGKVPEAQVTIDDQYVGFLAVVQRRGVALPVGTHRISVERTGYFPWDRLVEVHEGDPPVHLDAVLTPIPD
jgi:hypothetical protein